MRKEEFLKNPGPEYLAAQCVPESHVVKACIDWLWNHGCFVWRNNSGGYKPEGTSRFIRFGRKGSADIIGLTKHGRFIAVECKSAKGKLRPEQERFGEDVADHNGIFIVAYSTDDLEGKKELILSMQCPPAVAEGALRDYRVKSSNARINTLEEVGA